MVIETGQQRTEEPSQILPIPLNSPTIYKLCSLFVILNPLSSFSFALYNAHLFIIALIFYNRLLCVLLIQAQKAPLQCNK